MKRFGLIACALFLLAACANQPIYNVEDRAIPYAVQKFPLDRIQSLIIEGGQVRGWRFKPQGPGHLIAVQVQPKYSAEVDVLFSQTSYSVRYRSSTGMRAKPDGTVHQHYNFWIRNLTADIDSRFATASMYGSAAP